MVYLQFLPPSQWRPCPSTGRASIRRATRRLRTAIAQVEHTSRLLLMIYSGNQQFSRTLFAAVIFGTIVFLVYILLPTTTDSSQPQWPFMGTVSTLRTTSEDKLERVALVVASQTTDNTTWLDESFPTWEKAVYLTDAPSKLSVPVNKGRESMVYLTSVFPSISF
jgi:hypothetical protein